MLRFVALLRGINVGGRNPIKMADLKACLEGDGLAEVLTYIQSGNVIFSSPASAGQELTGRIERLLAARFGYRPLCCGAPHRCARSSRTLRRDSARTRRGSARTSSS